MVPWSRIVLYGNVEAANPLYPETGLWQQSAHQTAVRGLEKLTLVTAVAIRPAESIGIDGLLNVQEQLGELAEGVEVIRILLDSAEEHWDKTAWDEGRPAALPLETTRGLMARLYPRAVKVLQTLRAGGLLLSPTEDDFAHPDLAHYWVGKPGGSGRERVRLFKLAWDLCGEAFVQRLVQCERYYAGDPYRMRALRYLRYPKRSVYETGGSGLAGSGGIGRPSRTDYRELQGVRGGGVARPAPVSRIFRAPRWSHEHRRSCRPAV